MKFLKYNLVLSVFALVLKKTEFIANQLLNNIFSAYHLIFTILEDLLVVNSKNIEELSKYKKVILISEHREQ